MFPGPSAHVTSLLVFLLFEGNYSTVVQVFQMSDQSLLSGHRDLVWQLGSFYSAGAPVLVYQVADLF